MAVSDEVEVTYNVTAEGNVVGDDKAGSTVPSTVGVVGETMARSPLVNLFGMRGEGLHGGDTVAQLVRGSRGTNRQRGGRRNGQGRRGGRVRGCGVGIARGGRGVRAGTVSGRGGLTDSLRVMRLTTPAVREKSLNLLDRGGRVGFVPAYGLAVAGLLASEAAAFLQQSVAQGSRARGGGEALAIHDGMVDHHGDGGRGSGVARSGDEVGRAGWHSGTGGGRGARDRGARGARIRQRRKVRIFTEILVVVAVDLGGVFSSLLPGSKGLGGRGE